MLGEDRHPGRCQEIMGLEGGAYLQACMVCVEPAFDFTERNRQLPLDVVNSALVTGSSAVRLSVSLRMT